MISVGSQLDGSIRGRIRWTDGDGQHEIENKAQIDHIPSVARALGGSDQGHLTFMGAGSSETRPDAEDLTSMTSADEQDEVLAIQPVTLNVVEQPTHNGSVVQDVSAVMARATFGDESPQLNNTNISEMALFAGDRNLFARRILPDEEQPEKIQGMRIEFEWTIFYGVDNG